MHMTRNRVIEIEYNVRMLTASIKHEVKEWRKREEGRVLRRLAKKVDESRSKEEERAFREIAQDLEQFFKEEAAFAQADLDRKAAALRVEQGTGALCEFDLIAKERETRDPQKVQQDVANFKTRETAGPLQRKRFYRLKPPRSYYWPRKLPSYWDEKPTTGALAPQLNIPSIRLTAPDPESESWPNTRPEVIDTTMLSPADAQRITSTSPRRPSSSQVRKSRGRTGGHQRLAPKPSIFSYNICNHPRCPLTCYTHEKGVFRYPEKYVTDEEYASAATTFGTGNPPPWIWDVYLNAMNDLEASGGDTRAVSKEDIEIVGGFVAAHPKPCPKPW